MLLIDTSLWVAIYRDASGAAARSVQGAIGSEEFVFCQFIRAELLQGCRDEREWTDTREYLALEAPARAAHADRAGVTE